MFIDEHLTWKSHISHVNAKVSRSLFAVNQVKNILPKSCLRTLYYSLIQPYFSYGLLAWGSASLTVLKSPIMLQKRAIRNINRAKYRAHTELLFKSSLNMLLFEWPPPPPPWPHHTITSILYITIFFVSLPNKWLIKFWDTISINCARFGKMLSSLSICDNYLLFTPNM